MASSTGSSPRWPSPAEPEPPRRPMIPVPVPTRRFAALVAAAAVVLVLAGLIMLVVPGQGLLTLAVGLVLVDFPGKYRLERWLVTRPPVWRAINWLRKRAGREPLERPGEADARS